MLVFPSPHPGEQCHAQQRFRMLQPPLFINPPSSAGAPPQPTSPSLGSFTFPMFFFFSLPLSFPPVTPLPSSAGLPRCWAHQPAAGLSQSPPRLLLTTFSAVLEFCSLRDKYFSHLHHFSEKTTAFFWLWFQDFCHICSKKNTVGFFLPLSAR